LRFDIASEEKNLVKKRKKEKGPLKRSLIILICRGRIGLGVARDNDRSENVAVSDFPHLLPTMHRFVQNQMAKVM
jgi:hypothetical protein